MADGEGHELVRCAVYTRKSTEDGLEQEFNSLNAQREACEAYIASQRHEGWSLVLDPFDDGGISGGTMERPALLKLLDKVQSGQVDTIVVYKIDRLTRSLADFARIIEILDKAGASFVSVTQNFSTSTPMGRLTLHILLSFSQFERELTGERIRDKIAASKARGMWMGGVVPLGYDVVDRKLLVNEAEAKTVNLIFRRYLALGSVFALESELKALGIVSKIRISRSGKQTGGSPMSRGALYLLLRNRIYIGKICHKGKAFEGEHNAIVDESLFNAVQQQLEHNRVDRKHAANAAHPSLLISKIIDGHGRPMSPSHANKGTRRYRYYISRILGTDDQRPVWRIPAGDLEELVIGKLRTFLSDDGAIYDVVAPLNPDAVCIENAILAATRLARKIELATPMERRQLTSEILQMVKVHAGSVELILEGQSLIAEHGGSGNIPIAITVTASLAKVGKEVRLVVPPRQSRTSVRKDPALIKLIVKAHAARQAVEESPELTVAEHARAQRCGREYFGVLLRLGFLAPDIVTAILEGHQPDTLNRQMLARLKGLPHDWPEQRAILGFG